MREIFLPGKREENKMLGGFGHGGLSLFCSDSRAYELDCVFRVSGGVFLSPFPFFLCPNSPLCMTPASSREPQNTIPMVPSFSRVGLPVENTCGGKNTKITLLSLRGNPFRDGERPELFFFLLLFVDWTIINFCWEFIYYWRGFFSMWVFGSIVEGQMGIAAWVDFWVFHSAPSVYVEPAPCYFFSPMTL